MSWDYTLKPQINYTLDFSGSCDARLADNEAKFLLFSTSSLTLSYTQICEIDLVRGSMGVILVFNRINMSKIACRLKCVVSSIEQ